MKASRIVSVNRIREISSPGLLIAFTPRPKEKNLSEQLIFTYDVITLSLDPCFGRSINVTETRVY